MEGSYGGDDLADDDEVRQLEGQLAAIHMKRALNERADRKNRRLKDLREAISKFGEKPCI